VEEEDEEEEGREEEVEEEEEEPPLARPREGGRDEGREGLPPNANAPRPSWAGSAGGGRRKEEEVVEEEREGAREGEVLKEEGQEGLPLVVGREREAKPAESRAMPSSPAPP
jgi:hypothetical protein